jgi:hypothetical protein
MADYQNQALFFGHAKLIALPILHRNRSHSDFQPVFSNHDAVAVTASLR